MPDVKISALPTASLPPSSGDLVPILQGGVSRQITRADLVNDRVLTLTATQANATTTPAAAAALATTVAQGQYLFKYWIAYRSSAVGVGIQISGQHTGTTTRFVGTSYHLTTGGGAATGIADQLSTATAQMMEGKAQRVSGAAPGATQGVDTANADMFAVLEGIAIVTVSGTLNLMFNASATGTVTLMEGTSLTLTRTA